MANPLLTTDLVTDESVMLLENLSVLGKMTDRQWEKNFKGVGESIKIRLRIKAKVGTGEDTSSSTTDAQEASRTLTLDKFKHVRFEFSSTELSLRIAKFNERYVEPAMIALAQEIENDVANEYKKIFQLVGTPGSTTFNFATLAAARATLDRQGVQSEIYGAFGSDEMNAFCVALQLVQPDRIATTAIEKAFVKEYAGVMLFTSDSLAMHTVGALGGTPLVNGAQSTTYAASKATMAMDLVTDGWSNSIAGLLNVGDTFTIAGVNSVNYRTGNDTGILQNFVVNAVAASDGSGNSTINISPAIITTDEYKTVTAAAADNAAITVTSGSAGQSYRQNLVMAKGACAMGVARLHPLHGADSSSKMTKNGFAVRCTYDSNVDTGKSIFRFDILYGLQIVEPLAAVRITS